MADSSSIILEVEEQETPDLEVGGLADSGAEVYDRGEFLGLVNPSDIEPILEDIDMLKERTEDFSIDADDLGLYQDEETGYVYPTYRDQISSNGIPLAASGGGGGGSSTTAKITANDQTGWRAASVSLGASCVLAISWSSIEDGESTGDGTLTVTVNDVIRRTLNVAQGMVSVNVGEYLTLGTNKVKIRVTDVYDQSRVLSYTISVVNLTIESSFDTSAAFAAGQAIGFSYTPFGALEKTVHFEVDGTEVATASVTTSGRQQTQALPGMAHGAHTLRVWFTGLVDGLVAKSNELYYSLVVVEEGVTAPVVAVRFPRDTATQYETLDIPYTVYTPGSLSSDVTLSANGRTISRLSVDRTEQVWSYRADTSGTLRLAIASGTTTQTVVLTVERSDMDIEPESDSLALHLSSVGRSNSETHPEVWRDTETESGVSATLTGFNFVSDGWQRDDDGMTALRVSGDARVTIPYQPFAQDFRTTGKTIELEFAVRDVLDYDEPVMSCMSGGRGFRLTPQLAFLASEQTQISAQFKEDEHVRVAFVARKRSEYRLLLVYINGIMSGAVQYADDDDFAQASPVGITVGSEYGNVDLYNVRVYDTDLTSSQVLRNWIADTQDVTIMLSRYAHNDVYDEYGQVVIEKLPSDLPYMIIECAELPQYKGDKKTVSGSYVDPVDPTRSFDFEGCQANVQGTSSAPYARKNYDLQFKGGFEMAGGEHAEAYALAAGIKPFNRFVLKADVASSEGANNVELVKLFCDADPYKRPEELSDPTVRKGIYGFPIVVFWRTPRGQISFLGKYNFNLPKRAPGPYGYTGEMESWEFQNNTSDLMLFLTDTFDQTMITDPTTGEAKEGWRYDYEARFPDDTWTDTDKLQELQSFVYSTYRANATGDALAEPVTYDGTTYATDTADYRLAKFRAEFGRYAEVDSFIFYYIFTELFLMVDSRAKNLFIGFSGGPATGLQHIDRKAVAEPYDMDTAIGTNNEGSLVFGYSLEDTDHLAGGADVFNGQSSVLWNNVRDAFPAEIVAMYQQLRSGGTLSYGTVEGRFAAHQAKWPEAIFNEDAQFKYIDPLVRPDSGKLPTDVYLPMLQGSKAEQRRWWLYNRFRYMDSKWNAGDALSEVIQLRGYAKADITVTPYADIYPAVKYGSYLVTERGQHDVATTLPCPLSNVNDTEIYVYSASQLSSVGDLSGLKVGFADFSMATKLRSIKVGDASAQYENPNLTGLSVGTNPFLATVDARNCTALAGALDLSGAANIEHVYTDGTAITSCALPVGGLLKTLHLPATIANLTVRNQPGITSFEMPSYANVSTLRLENCGTALPVLQILNAIPTNARVRIIGLDMTVSTAAEVEAFYDKLDTMRGLDESGNNLDSAVVSGMIRGLDSVTGAWLAAMEARYPDIEITYNHITSNLYYYNWDGTQLLHTEAIADGGSGTWSSTPSRSSTAQYSYAFVGWNRDMDAQTADSTATKNVTADRSVYAAYSRTVRTYTITWKNADNTVLETDTNVAYGSTPSYNGATPTYQGQTARGWTPTPSTVTGDQTYTASYIPTYTVRFYNGTTLLDTQTVQQGGTATYGGTTPVNPDDATLPFIGWNPTPTNVQANMDCYAQFQSPVQVAEITDSWDTIIANVTNGTAASLYKVGNYKPLDLGAQGTINMQIVGKGVDALASGSGYATLSFVGMELLETSHRMNPSRAADPEDSTKYQEGTGAIGGWEHSEMRTYLADTIKPLIPSNVSAAIKAVSKNTNSRDTSGNSVANVVTTDELWIPSHREVFNSSSYDTVGPAYSDIFTDATSRIKKKPSATSASSWWLRSAGSGANFRCVYSAGGGNGSNANNTNGVALGFSI